MTPDNNGIVAVDAVVAADPENTAFWPGWAIAEPPVEFIQVEPDPN